MDVKITTTIVDVRKENDLYRLELKQKASKSTVEVNVSLLVKPNIIERLASTMPPYTIESLLNRNIECIIEDDKHFSIFFPIEGTFAAFPYSLDYPITAILQNLNVNRGYNLSSFTVFSNEETKSDAGDYFCEDYFLATECLNAFKVASGVKDFPSLTSAKLTVKADGLCYSKVHLWAEKIDFSISQTTFK